MKLLKKEKERLTREDVMIIVRLIDEDTEAVITDPQDFHLRFYVRGYTAQVICSREAGGVSENCRVESDGRIICFLEKNTFMEGRLLLEDLDKVAESGFADGDFETIERIDTGIIYIE